MLQVAQKFVRFRQVMKILAADVLLVVKLLQGEEGPARPQPALFSAIDALQALDQKFNVPDAAAVELYEFRAGLRPRLSILSLVCSAVLTAAKFTLGR